ncbi:MAG: Crp/Fnr family transcriptional regulator [Gemmatimonadales bacterium]
MFTVRHRRRPHVGSEGEVLVAPRLADHSECVVLSQVFRGKLCDDLARGPARRLAAGEAVYRMGDPARSVYLVRRGLVKTVAISPGGQELTLRIHRPGDILGELCLCSGERREQAVALEASEVVAITLEMLVARLRQDPLAALDMTCVACEHLAEAYDRLQSLSVDPTMYRLARTLMDLAADLGESMPDGMLILRYITQQELAHLIGARREVVSSLLNRLRDHGLIRYRRRGPITVDPGALSAFLESAGHA